MKSAHYFFSNPATARQNDTQTERSHNLRLLGGGKNNNNNNNTNNNQDNVYGAVIMVEPLREFTRFI